MVMLVEVDIFRLKFSSAYH